MTELNDHDRESAHLIAEAVVRNIHRIGNLESPRVPLHIRRAALREIHAAVHQESDDSETDSD